MATLNEILKPDKWLLRGAGPLYVQFRNHIEEAIRTGEIQPGEPMPSERDLAEISGISRITVRKAVQDLVRVGLITQKQGSGTTVAPLIDKVEQSLTRLTSFSEDMERRGKTVRSIWLERGLFNPSPKETMALGLKPHDTVARISRLRLADEVPLAIEHASIASDYLPDPENVGSSLYQHLSKHGYRPSRAIQRISAINMDEDNAKFLEVATGVAGLNIERVSYLSTGQIIEFTQSIYRGDAYDFVAELQLVENGQ